AKVTRPDVARQEEFAADFQVENGPDRLLPDGREFDYRLRPLRADVKAVHLVRVVYYRPGRGYQPTYAGDPDRGGDTIPLTVRPRTPTPEPTGPLDAPAFLLDVPTGPGVLRAGAPGWTRRYGLLA